MRRDWRPTESADLDDEKLEPAATHDPRVAPGKTTLTSALRRKAAPAPSAAAPPPGNDVDVARAGFVGAASAFPHRDVIERSFGAPLPATAYLDEHAGRASAALGADGYALGEQVAFATATPSLALAAHEAAHVIQATAGVALHGGDGAYEAHADLVAERVVRGESAAELLRDGPAAATAVRKQVAGGSGGSSAAAAPGPASPGGSPAQRMQAAIATGEPAVVRALQRELRQPAAADPAHPAPDAGEALTAARHWMMERIAAIRDSYAARRAAAETGPTPADEAADEAAAQPAADQPASGAGGAHHGRGGGNHPGARGGAAHPAHGRPPDPSHTGATEAVEVAMDTECMPLLEGLLEGDPQVRYEHPDAAVTRKVAAAVRLHSTRRAVGQVTNDQAAETEARAHGGVHTGNWCGAFAYTQAEQGGGFDRRWSENMQGTPGIVAALHYRGSMLRTWMWIDGHWIALRDYHRQRGSERSYEEVQRAAPQGGIEPGDLALIDNAFGTNPDHIATVISFDGRYLTAVGGNQGPGDRAVSRSDAPFDLSRNPEPNDVPRVPGSNGQKPSRVHGIGRWSIVDYEQHTYALADTMPTKPPAAAPAAHHRGRGH